MRLQYETEAREKPAQLGIELTVRQVRFGRQASSGFGRQSPPQATGYSLLDLQSAAPEVTAA